MCEYTVQNLSTHGINEIPKDFYLLIWATEDAATGDRLRPRDSLSADAVTSHFLFRIFLLFSRGRLHAFQFRTAPAATLFAGLELVAGAGVVREINTVD